MSNDYTASIECLCVKPLSISISPSFDVDTRLVADPANMKVSVDPSFDAAITATRVRTMSCSVGLNVSSSPKLSVNGVLMSSISLNLDLDPGLTAIYAPHVNIDTSLSTSLSYVDKLSGDFGDYECAQKLYPIGDKTIDAQFDHFVGPHNETSGLYDFIDEGVFTGDYDDKNSASVRLADDKSSYIHPSAVHTIGEWQYKCEVTAPIYSPDETRLRIRTAAPMANSEVGTPPKYTISGIMLEDPSGTLIVEYDAIVLRGDADFYDPDYVNFTTYSVNAKTNNILAYHGGDPEYPLMQEGSGYTLRFNVIAEALDDAFDGGFSAGFEENNLSHDPYASGDDHMAFAGASLSDYDQQFLNPTHALKISAIEICNSGGIGPRIDNALNIYSAVRATGNRIERTLLPSLVPTTDFSTIIWPDIDSVWVADSTFTNETETGSKRLIQNLKDTGKDTFITLQSTTITDSGKLTLKMTHGSNPNNLFEITPGAFDSSFDGSSANCISDGAFNRENKNVDSMSDHYFDVECVKLRVLAKKAVGSRDYYLDVVGYSDDKLLNITSASGGFLQNPAGGSGTHPVSSGFAGNLELLGGDALSSDDDYALSSGNPGGDHYLLTTIPLVSGLGFEWYEIPLQVYDDTVDVGTSRDYSLSPMFEKLYLDIYPIPSGASIAKVELLVRYKPQNAFNMLTEGGESIRKVTSPDDNDAVKIFPTTRGSGDDIINAGPDFAPLSTIENIPHAYTTPTSIKTNYSRRWRGMDGVNTGPFDPDQFDFSFQFSTADSPFMSGSYNFEGESDLTVRPNVGSLSGYITTSLSPYRFKNLGWRFQNNDVFSNEMSGWSSDYKTIDWTALSNGGSNFTGDSLYGQIADASKNFVRLRGHQSYINFGDIGTSGTFATHIRFSPDVNVSGVGYNLWNSGCLFSKWDAANNLEFALHYASGYLRGIARDTAGTVHTVQDSTHYSNYQFPLSVILSYSGGLHLYTDNEFEPNWNVLRDSGAPFTMNVQDSDFVVGHSPGSGVGFNMFVSEIGISERANITPSGADKTLQQVDAETYLGNNRVFWWDSGESYTNDAYKIWQNVDEDTRLDWTIGAFKFCEFDSSFDIISKRTGRDLINFHLVHDGTAYITNADLAMPSNVDSGVAYHTQVENDFLRFNLSDTQAPFYSTLRRITKDLPRGYKFAEDALVVETILEHKASGNIVWPNGDIGPRLIVSLYTKNKDPYWTPDEPNWGLINREIHYLEPSSCITRVDSKFTYDSICDESEQWAMFPSEPRLSEFSEKYFSQDVDDMFLQYDLAYPSGNGFESRLDIHAAHVRMDNAYVSKQSDNDQVNISTSGGFVVDENLNMFIRNTWETSSGNVNLYTIGPLDINISGFNLTTSGAVIIPDELNLFTENREVLTISGVNLHIDGNDSVFTVSSGTVNLHTFGKGVLTSASGNNLGMALTAMSSDSGNLPDAGLLNMFTHASDIGTEGLYSNMPIFLLNNIPQAGSDNKSLNLRAIGTNALFSRYNNGSMNLSITNDEQFVSKNINLTLYGDNIESVLSSGQVNLYAANYGEAGVGSDYFRWFNNNYGSTIDLTDNDYAKLAASDEIRGVDTIGYGSCDGDSPDKATDPEIVTDDTVWRPETCNDGGVIRGETTYTNGLAGYSGNYYGIRKYTELLPHSPYWATMTIKTGDTESIRVPNDFEEWEYGITNDVTYDPVKQVADAPITMEPSGRNAGDKYGKAVAVRGDLMAVGAPFLTIPDSSGEAINNAGSVFLYRRGADIPGEQAAWAFEEQLLLPSGYRRDFSSATIANLICYPDTGNPEFCVSGYRWNVGMEGREFGHSIDVANSGNEVIVVGAPGASWNRDFEEITSSGIPVTMVVFTDKFTYDEAAIGNIANTANKYDVLYRYFSAPWNAGASEFQPRLDINLIVCQLVFSDQTTPLIESEFDWFHHVYINRLDDIDLKAEISEAEIENEMASGVEGAFLSSITRNTAKPHSNIPPIIGIFTDNSPSTKNTAAFSPVVDRLKNFYETYAYDSGVINPTDLSAQSGYINQISAPSESWGASTVNLLNQTLTTGNLQTNDALFYITSGIGQQWANSNAYQFQIPAPSGGRAYVFEKESGNWNLVQEIKSGSERLVSAGYTNDGAEQHYAGYGVQHNDRFGHSVSISQDGEVLAIGSPYSSTPFEVFEKNTSETTRMYNGLKSWLTYRSKTDRLARYNQLVADSGANVAQRQVYHELSTSDKFFFRTDELYWGNAGIIEPYQSIYSYGYGNIPYVGTWKFIPDEYAGSSRIGFSTAVSEDGDTVAFGAPTDSFNKYDDTNVWFKGYDTWASYTNAGAVRVFESRKYYPHSGAVEYYKFGNLDRTANPDLVGQGYYDQMGLYFAPDNIDFTRMEFEALDIPQHAGLAFIITPELDASSDEVIDNIKDWMSLGDRTLVLVGNDPTWEDGGIYKDSNDIVNTILEKLDSRMRLHPARTKYESLPAPLTTADVDADKYNVVRAFRPAYSNTTYVNTGSIFANGVADIRIDLSTYNKETFNSSSPCDNINSRCEMPLKHDGDLRAQWNKECTKTVGNKVFIVKYKENWPRMFGASNPSDTCDAPPSAPINRPSYQPTPILTAAEHIPPSSYIIPATSGYNQFITPVYEEVCETIYSTYLDFDEPNITDQVGFFLIADPEGYPSGDPSGIFTSFDAGTFFDPSGINGRDPILQATGDSFFLPPVQDTRKVSNISDVITEELYYDEDTDTDTGSVVYLMADPTFEDEDNLGYTNKATSNNDQNIYFINNLIMIDCGENGNGSVIQIGGWTGRTSFEDAYSGSAVTQALDSYGQGHTENVTYIPGEEIDVYTNVVWIANPTGKPSEFEVTLLKNWLKTGNKKLVITYDNSQERAFNVTYLCDELGLNSKPWYSNSEGEYLSQSKHDIDRGGQQLGGIEALTGCDLGYGWDSSSNFCGSYCSTTVESIDFNGNRYIPINKGARTNRVVYYNDEIWENYWNVPEQRWRLDAESTGVFPAQEGSGYRVYINYVSENIDDKFDSTFFLQNATRNENSSTGAAGLSIQKSATYTVETTAMTVKATDSELPFKFRTTHNNISLSEMGGANIPRTSRILSVSGVLVPIVERTAVETTCYQKWIEDIITYVYWENPEQEITIPGYSRPILTLNDKYCAYGCAKGGQWIEDGPVVVAEEIESFSSGLNGNNRSKIVLISDSSMIQGKNPYYRNDASSENQRFIRSLYPPSPASGDGERRFEETAKLRSPERGSPAKYYSVSNLAGNTNRFSNTSPKLPSAFVDNEDTYLPADVVRLPDPKDPLAIKNAVEDFGDTTIPAWGPFPRMSGTVDGTIYVDAGIGGGAPEIMKQTGRDYLDLDVYFSGYPGDLFGYSISFHKGTIMVGTPFSAFGGSGEVSWDQVIASGTGIMDLSGNGGAGAVYFYERSDAGDWDYKQKIKPSSIHTGVDGATISDITNEKGPHYNDGDFCLNYGLLTDQFGHSVSMDADMVAIGAPNHDYGTAHQYLYNSGAFLRKEFNAEFDIMTHDYFDLGDSGVRIDLFGGNSGTMVLNGGTVYTYRRTMYDWQNRAKEWRFAEKLNAQGYAARNTGPASLSGTENDFFGKSVYLDRARRGDGDYTLAIGAQSHKYALSGNHTSTQPLGNAGASYVFDAMLRDQVPAIPNSGGWIEAEVFGDRADNGQNKITQRVYQNTSGGSQTFQTSGIVFSNINGDIFIEVSGFDPATKGFIAHRPYVESVIGEILDGTQVTAQLSLLTSGKPVEMSGQMNLAILGPDSAIVYNSVGLTTTAWHQINVGSGNNPLTLMVSGKLPASGSEQMNVFISGTIQTTDSLPIRVRGR